jgi:membrane protein YdbS with pleckstrin-like domain
VYDVLKSIVFPLLKVEESEPTSFAGSHESLQVFRACPAFLSYNLFFWKLYVAALALGVAAVSAGLLLFNRWFIVLVVPLVLFAAFKAAVFYVTTRLNYDMRWYVITDRSLLIREGVWIVREITLTFANAQNVRITQGPLQRYFGFSHVEVDTAGGGGGHGGGDRDADRSPGRCAAADRRLRSPGLLGGRSDPHQGARRAPALRAQRHAR